jgi:hypothetical protein
LKSIPKFVPAWWYLHSLDDLASTGFVEVAETLGQAFVPSQDITIFVAKRGNFSGPELEGV